MGNIFRDSNIRVSINLARSKMAWLTPNMKAFFLNRLNQGCFYL